MWQRMTIIGHQLIQEQVPDIYQGLPLFTWTTMLDLTLLFRNQNNWRSLRYQQRAPGITDLVEAQAHEIHQGYQLMIEEMPPFCQKNYQGHLSIQGKQEGCHLISEM
uniref:Uncharacterized protein n=1 Tax=Picea sitchensis TaxID=3332 RepID=A9NWX6_PICSI|nr:unknown [Picea sitchensis]